MPKRKPIPTTWEVYTYDVWGNAKDGYEVNNTYRDYTIDLDLQPITYNPGTPQAFISAYPTIKQIRDIFGTRAHLDLDGDDLHIYVTRRRDGYPIGELYCISHDSLSPVRAKEPVHA